MSDAAPDLHDALAPRAFLHEDPDSYLAGVDDALAAADGDERPSREEPGSSAPPA